MKIIPQNSKKILSVLGMPHGGTTIVGNIFNSMDNAFCLSEPHWALISNPGAIRFDKAHGLNFKTPDDILPSIRKKLNSDGTLQFAGLKETFRPKEKRMKKYFERMLNSDIVIFVFREPRAHYNSFKVMSKHHKRKPMPLEYMIDTFNSLYETVQSTQNSMVIVLEDLCAAGNDGAMQYINGRSGELFKIHGTFAIKPTNYIYGNARANRSNKIAAANVATDLLTDEEIKTLNKELRPKYEKIRLS